MIDLYLEACYATDTKQQEKRAFVEALKKLPNDELMKVAQTGKIAHFGCDDEKETWLDRYKGTPLFDQAVAIEQQNLQLEAQRLQEDQERRNLHPIEDTIWQQQDQLRLQRRLLDLQLAQLGQQQLTGAPAMPEGAPQGAGAPGPESAPVGVEVAPKTAAEKAEKRDRLHEMLWGTPAEQHGGLIGAGVGGLGGAALGGAAHGLPGALAGGLGGAALGGLGGQIVGHLGQDSEEAARIRDERVRAQAVGLGLLGTHGEMAHRLHTRGSGVSEQQAAQEVGEDIAANRVTAGMPLGAWAGLGGGAGLGYLIGGPKGSAVGAALGTLAGGTGGYHLGKNTGLARGEEVYEHHKKKASAEEKKCEKCGKSMEDCTCGTKKASARMKELIEKTALLGSMGPSSSAGGFGRRLTAGAGLGRKAAPASGAGLLGGFQHGGQAIPGVPESVLRQSGHLGGAPGAAAPVGGGTLHPSEAADFAKKVRGGTVSGALGSARDAVGGAFGKLKGMFGGGGASAPVELGLRGTPGGTVAHNPGYAAALRAGPTQSWMKPTGSWGTPYKTAEANAAYMMKLMEKSALDLASLKKGLQTAGQGLAHTGVHKPALMGAGIGALAGGVGGALSTDEQGHHSLGKVLAGAAGGGALGGAAGAVHHNYGRSSAADIGGKLQDAFNTTGNQAKAAVGTTMSGGKPPVIPKSAPHPTVAATHGMPGMTQPGPAVIPPGVIAPTQAIPASQPIPAQAIRPSGVAPTQAFDQARPTPVRLRAA